jgi:hypothetical protein
VDTERVRAGPLTLRASRPHQLDERLNVPNPRHIFEMNGLVRDECRRHDRKRGILIACRSDGAGEALSTFDDELNG